MLILGIESSCDETAASVCEDFRKIRSSVISTQIEEHKKYGGVVPEIASRRHCENILEVTKQALRDADVTLADLDGIAVTYAPGLIGALLVGVNFAKSLAFAAEKPLIPVHHISGHIAANYICHEKLEPPYLCIVASGAHSHLIEVLSYTEFRVIGRTRDDAAGECFDKCARAMGFPYPGGVHIDRHAQEGNPLTFKLPHPVVAGNEYDFSFSGLKTSVINMLHRADQKGEIIDKKDLSASIQHTISEIITEKTMGAAEAYGYKKIALAGGVSANSGVRAALSKTCSDRGFEFYMPELSLCGDNAAMIACQGSYNFAAGIIADESLNAVATMPIDSIKF